MVFVSSISNPYFWLTLQHQSQGQKDIQQLHEEEQDIVQQPNEVKPDLPEMQTVEDKPTLQPQAIKKKKRTRMRQLEKAEASIFMKQPGRKITNPNKDLKRAYEKGFFDDSKFDFIRSLRKIRRHPEQDSVSSHYGSNDQSFDINDVLPKRGFQRKKAINQDLGQVSSVDSQAPKQKKISKPRKPRKPRQPRQPKQPKQPKQPSQPKPRVTHQPRKARQLRNKKQEASEKELKKQPRTQEIVTQQRKKEVPKKSGVQIRITKAPTVQMLKKNLIKDNSQDSQDQSESEFKSSEGSKDQQQIMAQKIREAEKLKEQQKLQNKNNYKKQQLAQKFNKTVQDGDQLRISVQEAQKILTQPPKVQIVNLNPQIPLPLVSNVYLPPNIPIRNEQLPNKISIKQLLPQDSKNESSGSQSSDSSSSQSSSSSGSTSSDQEGQSKLLKQKKKKKRSRSSSSQDSQKDKKKKKKDKKKHKHRQNQSESILTKLIKNDKLRKMLVKQKQKELEKKLTKNEKEEKKLEEKKPEQKKKQVPNLQMKKIQQQKIEIKKSVVQKANESKHIENKANIKKSAQIEEQKINPTKQVQAMDIEKPAIPTVPQAVQNTKQLANQIENHKKQTKQAKAKTKMKSLQHSTFKMQPIIIKEEKIEKSNLNNRSQTTYKVDNPKLSNQNEATSDIKQLQKIEQIKPASSNRNVKQKPKKLKNLSMENNVVGLKVTVGQEEHSKLKEKKKEEAQVEQKSKETKRHEKNRIPGAEQIKIKHRIKQSETQESSDSSQARYYNHKRKHKHIPRQVVRYRKVIVQRSQSSQSDSSEQYPRRRVIRRIKRKYPQSESSESDQQAIDYRLVKVQGRKGQKVRQAIKKKR